MAGDIGQKLGTLAALDSSLSVAAATNNVNGTYKDVGANTSPQPTVVGVQFAITNAGSTDGYDLDVRVQFSDDNTTWPDAGEGQSLGNFYSSTAGADMTRSRIITLVPLLRYFRFQYDNNNATDAVTVDSVVALHYDQYT